jgi:hypothetical protein
MSTIAVLCASAPEFNPGMHTVDLAFWRFVRRELPGDSVHFFCHPAFPDHLAPLVELPFSYRGYDRCDLLEEYERIVVWGDFLHNRNYLGELTIACRARWPGRSDGEIEDILYELLLFEGRGAALADRTVVAGVNLMTMDTATMADTRYQSAVFELYRSARLVLGRDPFSAHTVNQILGDFASSHVGLDGAFLGGAVGVENAYRTRASTPRRSLRIGVFAGRSWYYEPLFMVAAELCRRLGSRGRWLPWFHHRPWPLLEKYGDEFEVGSENGTLLWTLAQLEACDVVITDTYHLCVNAWSRGIPAICVGRGIGSMRYSTDDKKKEVLYASLGALDLYLYSEVPLAQHLQLEATFTYESLDQCLTRVCETIRDPSRLEPVFRSLDRSRAVMEDRLRVALQ